MVQLSSFPFVYSRMNLYTDKMLIKFLETKEIQCRKICGKVHFKNFTSKAVLKDHAVYLIMTYQGPILQLNLPIRLAYEPTYR